MYRHTLFLETPVLELEKHIDVVVVSELTQHRQFS